LEEEQIVSRRAVIQAVSVNTRHLNSVDRDDADVSCLYAVLPADNSTGRHRLPSRSAFFPLVVGELLDVGAVVTHHENLPVRLRRVRVRQLAKAIDSPSNDHDICASFPLPFVSRLSDVPSGLIVKMS